MIIVEQIENKNQFKIFCKYGVAFQSYDNTIAFKNLEGCVYLSDKWDYSEATLKHLKLFLNSSLTKAEIFKKIESGTIQVVEEQVIFNLAQGNIND